MRYLELFAGAHGLGSGLDRAGWIPVALAEIDLTARGVLRHLHPTLPILGDVKRIDGRQFRGRIDALWGGSPCQDLSVAGKGAGLEGARSGLFYEQHRIWMESEAPYFGWENVAGALSSNQGKDFACILSTLVGGPVRQPAKWGKSGVAAGPVAVAAWRVLDLQHVGPPQRRARVFIVAARAGGCDPAEILALHESVCRHPGPRDQARQAAAARAVAGADRDGGAGTGYDVPDIAGTLGTITGGLRSTDLDVNGAWPVAINNDSRGSVSEEAFALRGDDRQQQSVLAVNVEHALAPHGGQGTDGLVEPLGASEHKGHTVLAFDWQKGNDVSNVRPSTMNVTEEGTGTLGSTRVPAVLAFDVKQDGSSAGEVAPTLKRMGHADSHANGGGQMGVMVPGEEGSVMNTLDARTGRSIQRAGVRDRDVAVKNVVVQGSAFGFNYQNGGGYGDANDGLGIVREGIGPLSKSQVPAVALPEPFAFKASHFTRGKDGAPTDVVAPLSADADKGDQEPIIFDTTQVTHPENRSNPGPGLCHPLAAGMHPPALVPAEPDETVFKRRGGFGWSESTGLSPTLESQGGSHQGGPDNLPMVLGPAVLGVDIAPTLGARDFKGPGNFHDGSLQASVFPTGRVRRLLPVECERLMGWEDGRTAFATYTLADLEALHRDAMAEALDADQWGPPKRQEEVVAWVDQIRAMIKKVVKAGGSLTVELKDTNRYKLAGNGCSPVQTEWIAKRITYAEAHTP